MKDEKISKKVRLPTAVLRSKPKITVNTINIIIPTPVPTKPVPNPIVRPKNSEINMPFIPNLSVGLAVSFLLISGFIKNLIPMKKDKNRENPPKTTFPACHAKKLPITHITSIVHIIIKPFLMSIFLFFI